MHRQGAQHDKNNNTAGLKTNFISLTSDYELNNFKRSTHTATFNYHIPIHGYSDSTWRQHQWKQAETMIALALALQSAKKLFQKGNLENKRMILTLSGVDICAQNFVIDSWRYRGHYGFTDTDIFFKNEI